MKQAVSAMFGKGGPSAHDLTNAQNEMTKLGDSSQGGSSNFGSMLPLGLSGFGKTK